MRQSYILTTWAPVCPKSASLMVFVRFFLHRQLYHHSRSMSPAINCAWLAWRWISSGGHMIASDGLWCSYCTWSLIFSVREEAADLFIEFFGRKERERGVMNRIWPFLYYEPHLRESKWAIERSGDQLKQEIVWQIKEWQVNCKKSKFPCCDQWQIWNGKINTQTGSCTTSPNQRIWISSGVCY